MTQQTVAVRLTGTGRGAVATVLLHGQEASQQIARFFTPIGKRSAGDVQRPLRRNITYFGHWRWQEYTEELVVCHTDENEFEIHCHGGELASTNILRSLASAGVQSISADEWIDRAEPDPFVAEARKLLVAVQTERALKIVLDQINGAMRRELTEILGHLEGEFDPSIQPNSAKANCTQQAIELLQAIVDRSDLGQHLVQPWRVALVGEPNAGKSSLINAMVGFTRAVVNDQPGTTRDLVSVETAIAGLPAILIDTAGLRESSDAIETTGIELARHAITTSDVVLLVQDLTKPMNLQVDDLLIRDEARIVRVGTKRDLLTTAAQKRMSERGEHTRDFDVVTSAVSGDGVASLIDFVAGKLVPIAPSDGAAVPLSFQRSSELQRALDALRTGDTTATTNAIRTLLRK